MEASMMMNLAANVVVLTGFLVLIGLIGIFDKKLWLNFCRVIDWVERCGGSFVLMIFAVWFWWSVSTMWTTPVLGGAFFTGLVLASE